MSTRREFLTATAATSLLSAEALAAARDPKAAARPRRQIFGIGGKFFPDVWDKPVLPLHLLSLAGKPEPRICFLGTATGDSPDRIEEFYREMGKFPCRVRHLNMFKPHTADFVNFLAEQDIIYVGGGATRNLMTIWRDWKLDAALRNAWEHGVVLSGVSAGSICWFQSCITDSLPEKLLPLKCLGFLKGSACTHYEERPDRPTVFRSLIASGEIDSPGIATDNNVAIHYVDDQLVDVVTAKKGRKAYKVERVGNSYRETPIEARYIGA